MKKREYGVVSVIKHNGWDGSGASFPDIAIIKLARKVEFNIKSGGFIERDSILPACLPNHKMRDQLYDTKAFVAGNS